MSKQSLLFSTQAGICYCFPYFGAYKIPTQPDIHSPHIVSGRVFVGGRLDAVGDEAEDGADPEQEGETPEEVAAELDPLRGGLGRRQLVGAVPQQNLLGSLRRQTLQTCRFRVNLNVGVS